MHLGGNILRNVYAESLRGYKKALKDYKIPFDEKLLYISKLSEEAGTEAAEHILKDENAASRMPSFPPTIQPLFIA